MAKTARQYRDEAEHYAAAIRRIDRTIAQLRDAGERREVAGWEQMKISASRGYLYRLRQAVRLEKQAS